MARDTQSITPEGEPFGRRWIDGARLRTVPSVPTSYGYLTEIFRRDWGLDAGDVGQVFQAVLEPGAISAWHAHAQTLDRLFVSYGRCRIVLFDARRDSPTHGLVQQVRLGTVAPGLLIVPPGVWHGVQNESSGPSIVVNVVDRAYTYEAPDHYRLPADSSEIPFCWRDAASRDDGGVVMTAAATAPRTQARARA